MRFFFFLSDQILEVLYQLSEKNRIDGIRSRFLGLFIHCNENLARETGTE